MGGDVRIEGGALYAPGGHITLVAGSSPGEVSFDEFGYAGDSFETPGKISIIQQALVTTSGQASGSIFIRGGRLVMEDSVVGMANTGDIPDGDIDIHLTEALEMDGGLLGTTTGADGKGGNINIETGTLTLSGGAQIGTSTNSNAQAGNISVHATDSISITGRSSDGFRSALYSQTAGRGSSGNISVSASASFIGDKGAIFNY